MIADELDISRDTVWKIVVEDLKKRKLVLAAR
jgi:biotin operon repressor